MRQRLDNLKLLGEVILWSFGPALIVGIVTLLIVSRCSSPQAAIMTGGEYDESVILGPKKERTK